MVDYPKDWELSTLESKLSGKFWLMPATPSYVHYGIPYITSKNIKNGKIDFINSDKITYSDYCKVSRIRKIEYNDILISMIGTIGEIGIVDCDIDFYGQNIYLIRPNKKELDSKFFYYLFNLPQNKESILNNRGGSTQGYLRADSIIKKNFYFPKIGEQKAIADILTTFDKHIENLEKLINKKKMIRDGALEDSISGKTRLDGFEYGWDKTTSYPRGWEENRLDHFVYIYQGGTPSTANKSYWDGDIVWLTPSDVTKHTSLHIYDSERKITEEGLLNSSATLLPKGTILLCTRATVGELAIAGRPLATNQGFKNLVCRSNADSTFLAYLLGTKKEELLEKASGTTFLELSLRELSKINVLMPPLREQHAIASILTSMDEEINSLEQERNKIIQLKDGAMDDLLTGKVRLIKKE